MPLKEQDIEDKLIGKLGELKYTYRPDIRDKAALNANFRAKFNALNHVEFTDAEFERLLGDIIQADVFKASSMLREPGYMERDDGTPLHYSLVNRRDWCKNDYEVINQLRINTDNSHHRYDVILLVNGLPLVQMELQNVGVNPHRAMEQIVRYKNDLGNGYTGIRPAAARRPLRSRRPRCSRTTQTSTNTCFVVCVKLDMGKLEVIHKAQPDNGVRQLAVAEQSTKNMQDPLAQPATGTQRYVIGKRKLPRQWL